VGILSAQNRFRPESDHASPEAGPARVRELNAADRETQFLALRPVRERLAALGGNAPPLPPRSQQGCHRVRRRLHRHAQPSRQSLGPREGVIARHRKHVRNNTGLMAAVHAARGRDLVCFCAPAPCHGEILLALANGPSLKEQMALLRGDGQLPPHEDRERTL
jgi:hypothetical protein